MSELRRVRPQSSSGFTLIELMVAIIVSTGLIVGILNLFDLANKTALVQTEVAEMQQSHRVAQSDLVKMVRETARGMVPLDDVANGRVLPTGIAVEVLNNVGSGATLTPTGPMLVEGSDVLTLRGVYESPIYLVDYGDATAVTVTGNPATAGVLEVKQVGPSDVFQDLTALRALVEPDGAGVAPEPEALFIVGPRSDSQYAIVEVDVGASTVTANSVRVAFKVTGGTRTAAYQLLAPFPAAGLRNIAYLGVLEEYKFYIQDQRRIAGDASSPLMPRLAQARLYPGTNTAHRTNTDLQVPIADNVFDLQLALGIDTNWDEAVVDNSVATGTDEWLYNFPQEDAGPTTWVEGVNPNLNPPELDHKDLFYLRVNTLVHTDHKLRGYYAEPLQQVEDNRNAALFDSVAERQYRRRWLRTVVDFRNLY